MVRMLSSLRTSSSSEHGAAPKRLDFLLERLQRFEPAAGDDEIGAGTRQRAREGLPEPSARARDDSDFAGEIEGAHG